MTRRRVTGKVGTDVWKDRNVSIIRAKQSTEIHILLLCSVDSLRRNSKVPPADLCSGYTLHTKVGEVAAAARRSAKGNVNSSICFAAGAAGEREEFTLARDRV